MSRYINKQWKKQVQAFGCGLTVKALGFDPRDGGSTPSFRARYGGLGESGLNQRTANAPCLERAPLVQIQYPPPYYESREGKAQEASL